MCIRDRINTATVEENIEYLHELMDYYLKEKIQSRKESYVRNIKITFQKLACLLYTSPMAFSSI